MKRARWIRTVGYVALAIIGIFLILAPDLVNTFYLRILTELLVFGLLAMSIDILVGYTGLAPLGHAGIFGVSAYTIGYLTARAGESFYVAVPAGLVAAVVVSIIFGIMAIRTSGIYFLMITLAQGMIVWGLAFRWASVTGAENGIRGITRPPAVEAYSTYYYVVLIGFVILAAMMYRIVNSSFGLTLKGIRESESRMQTLGYNVSLHKFLGFCISGFFAGTAGALYVFHNNFVSPSVVEFATSAEALLMTILGGTGTLFGAVIGSAIITFTRQQISLFTDRWPMIMGAIFVATILFAQDGLVGGTKRLLDQLFPEEFEPEMVPEQQPGIPQTQRPVPGEKMGERP